MSMTGELIEVKDHLDEWFEALDQAKTDEERTQVQLVLTQLVEEHATRVDHIAKWLRKADCEMESLKELEDETAARRKQWEKKKATVRAILSAHMDQHSIPKYQGRIFTIRLDEGRSSVEILDEAAIPAQFKTIVQTVKVEKKAIEKALDNFQQVPGAVMVQGPPYIVIPALSKAKKQLVEAEE